MSGLWTVDEDWEEDSLPWETEVETPASDAGDEVEAWEEEDELEVI